MTTVGGRQAAGGRATNADVAGSASVAGGFSGAFGMLVAGTSGAGSSGPIGVPVAGSNAGATTTSGIAGRQAEAGGVPTVGGLGTGSLAGNPSMSGAPGSTGVSGAATVGGRGGATGSGGTANSAGSPTLGGTTSAAGSTNAAGQRGIEGGTSGALSGGRSSTGGSTGGTESSGGIRNTGGVSTSGAGTTTGGAGTGGIKSSGGTPSSGGTGTGGALGVCPTAAVFCDDFESGNAKWEVLQGTWSIALDGTNVFTASLGTNEARGFAGTVTWSDYTLTARVKILQIEADRRVYLAARASDANNWYGAAFYNDASPTLQIRKKVGGSSSTLASSAYAWAISRWYTVAFRVSGSTLTLSVDGVAILTIQDTSFAAGRIALLADRSQVEFDNVVVTSP